MNYILCIEITIFGHTKILNIDVIRLMIMTWKLVIDFGQYAGMSIHQIFSLKHTNYLLWIYYNYDKLSFNDEILKEIKVFGENYDNRIEKPGKNPEMNTEINKRFFNAAVHKNGLFQTINQAKKQRKRRVAKLDNETNRIFSKSKLQSKNQGH